jgi:hypothetical protein
MGSAPTSSYPLLPPPTSSPPASHPPPPLPVRPPSATSAAPPAPARAARRCPQCHEGVLLPRLDSLGPFVGCDNFQCRHVDQSRELYEELCAQRHEPGGSHASSCTPINASLTPVSLLLHAASPASFLVQVDARELDARTAHALRTRVAAVVRQLATCRIHLLPPPPVHRQGGCGGAPLPTHPRTAVERTKERMRHAWSTTSIATTSGGSNRSAKRMIL